MSYNTDVEKFRDEEYPYLTGKTYLDHGGTTLYAKSLVDAFSQDMLSNLYGNPHSDSEPSAVAGRRVDAVRERALRFFNADPEHFDLIFVSNATAAVKLVMDCFHDYARVQDKGKRKGFWYGYHKDAHSSIVGVRELSSSHRCFESDKDVEKWIQSGTKWNGSNAALGLFAFPGQSNMTGRRLPLSWSSEVRQANSHSRKGSKTYTLLDAAALATTAPLDLSDPRTAPDFTCLSFYKIFGFPNIGALIVRKASGHVLQKRRYFGGGTIDLITVLGSSSHFKREETLHDQLEDGTLPFLSIFALDAAMSVHAKLFTSMKSISNHTAYLASYMYSKLSSLTLPNGQPMLLIYNDSPSGYGNATVQGATIAFNVHDGHGKLIPCSEIEKMADEKKIYVRSGSLCNPGGIASYLGHTSAQLKAAYALGHRCNKPWSQVNNKPIGVVRVSLGAMSTKADVDTLYDFLVDNILPLERSLQPQEILSPLRGKEAPVMVSTKDVTTGPGSTSSVSTTTTTTTSSQQDVIAVAMDGRLRFLPRRWFTRRPRKTSAAA